VHFFIHKGGTNMKKTTIKLVPLKEDDRNQFILDNQEAFKYGAMQEFGVRDEHLSDDGEIISRKTIEESIDAKGAEAYRITENGLVVGGVVLKIDKVSHRNELELLFIVPKAHSRGIVYRAWLEIEKLYPETEVWTTCTPYFETRNIHFYINKCGFHAVAFYNEHYINPKMPETDPDDQEEGPDMMFEFKKVMKKSD